VYRDQGAEPASELLGRWAAAPPLRGNNLLIVGERGSGKTWMLKKFALDQWQRHVVRPWESPLALFIDLRKYSQHLLQGQGIRKSLSYFFCTKEELSSAGELYFWEALVECGRAMLLLDGFHGLASEITPSDMRHH